MDYEKMTKEDLIDIIEKMKEEMYDLELNLIDQDAYINDLEGDIDSLKNDIEEINYNRVTGDELDSVMSDLEDALQKLENFRYSLD